MREKEKQINLSWQARINVLPTHLFCSFFVFFFFVFFFFGDGKGISFLIQWIIILHIVEVIDGFHMSLVLTKLKLRLPWKLP